MAKAPHPLIIKQVAETEKCNDNYFTSTLHLYQCSCQVREKRNKEKDNIIQSSVNCSNTCIWRGVTRKTLLYVYPLSIDMVHCHYLTVLPLSFLCANLFLFKTPAKHLICNQNVEQTFCSIFSLPVPPNTHAGLCSCPSSR